MISHAKQTQNILFQKEYVQKYIYIKNTNLLVQGWKKNAARRVSFMTRQAKYLRQNC